MKHADKTTDALIKEIAILKRKREITDDQIAQREAELERRAPLHKDDAGNGG